jgi:hypothetical protein
LLIEKQRAFGIFNQQSTIINQQLAFQAREEVRESPLGEHPYLQPPLK